MNQRRMTEVTKHGAAAGEAGRPERAEWTIDQGWENYTADEHAVWKTLFERQVGLLPASYLLRPMLRDPSIPPRGNPPLTSR